MEGASALDTLLAEFPEAPLAALVVWEPVLPMDIAPPLSSALGRLGDRRVRQYWDPGQTLSAEIRAAVNAAPARYGLDEPLPDDFVVWDVVAVFGHSVRWSEALPVPAYYGGPVRAVIGPARAAIAAAIAGRTEPVAVGG